MAKINIELNEDGKGGCEVGGSVPELLSLMVVALWNISLETGIDFRKLADDFAEIILDCNPEAMIKAVKEKDKE